MPVHKLLVSSYIWSRLEARPSREKENEEGETKKKKGKKETRGRGRTSFPLFQCSRSFEGRRHPVGSAHDVRRCRRQQQGRVKALSCPDFGQSLPRSLSPSPSLPPLPPVPKPSVANVAHENQHCRGLNRLRCRPGDRPGRLSDEPTTTGRRLFWLHAAIFTPTGRRLTKSASAANPIY